MTSLTSLRIHLISNARWNTCWETLSRHSDSIWSSRLRVVQISKPPDTTHLHHHPHDKPRLILALKSLWAVTRRPCYLQTLSNHVSPQATCKEAVQCTTIVPRTTKNTLLGKARFLSRTQGFPQWFANQISSTTALLTTKHSWKTWSSRWMSSNRSYQSSQEATITPGRRRRSRQGKYSAEGAVVSKATLAIWAISDT